MDLLFLTFAWLACLQAAEEEAILDVVPSLSEPGPACSTTLITRLLDLLEQMHYAAEPRSQYANGFT